jgi:hypothetical protein
MLRICSCSHKRAEGTILKWKLEHVLLVMHGIQQKSDAEYIEEKFIQGVASGETTLQCSRCGAAKPHGDFTRPKQDSEGAHGLFQKCNACLQHDTVPCGMESLCQLESKNLPRNSRSLPLHRVLWAMCLFAHSFSCLLLEGQLTMREFVIHFNWDHQKFQEPSSLITFWCHILKMMKEGLKRRTGSI